MKKDLSTGWPHTSDLEITNQILFHCTTATLFRSLCGIYYETFRRFFSYWVQNFPAISVFTDRDFPATVVNGRDFLTVSAVTDRVISRQSLQLIAGIFRPKLFRHGNVKSLPPGTRRPGFSGCICSFWLGFSDRSFSGMGNFLCPVALHTALNRFMPIFLIALNLRAF